MGRLHSTRFVASALVALLGMLLLAGAATAGDQIRDRDKDMDQDRLQLRDSTCLFASTAPLLSDQIRDRDRDKDMDQDRLQLRDASCELLSSSASGDQVRDRVRQRDRTRDRQGEGPKGNVLAQLFEWMHQWMWSGQK